MIFTQKLKFASNLVEKNKLTKNMLNILEIAKCLLRFSQITMYINCTSKIVRLS